jgi:hypothetical protein
MPRPFRQLLLLVVSSAYYCDYDAEVTRFDALNGYMASDVDFVCSAEMTLILSNVHAPTMTRVYAQSMDDRTTDNTRSSRYLIPEVQRAMVSALTNVTQIEPSLDGKCERISYYQRGKVKLKWVMEYIRFPENQVISQSEDGLIDVEVNFKMMSTSCEVRDVYGLGICLIYGRCYYACRGATGCLTQQHQGSGKRHMHPSSSDVSRRQLNQ